MFLIITYKLKKWVNSFQLISVKTVWISLVHIRERKVENHEIFKENGKLWSLSEDFQWQKRDENVQIFGTVVGE